MPHPHYVQVQARLPNASAELTGPTAWYPIQRISCLGEDLAQRALGGEIAAHPVHADARWCRGRTDVQTPHRRGVGSPRRTCEQLPQVHDAGGDVAADEIRIPRFDLL